MRIRKAQNLTWWAMVNAAATFTDTGKNLAVYFGMSTSLKTMSNKLKDLIPYDEILLRTKHTLSEYAFGIAIFDNSQMFTKLKYQRNGQSSSSTIVTSRCFVKPWIPLDLDELIFHATAIEMTYIQQAIPSPPKLPSFETANHLSPLTYMTPEINNTEAVDVTGNRVDNYARIAMLQLFQNCDSLFHAKVCHSSSLTQITRKRWKPSGFQHDSKRINIQSFRKWDGASILEWAFSNIIQPSFGWENEKNVHYLCLQSARKMKRRIGERRR